GVDQRRRGGMTLSEDLETSYRQAIAAARENALDAFVAVVDGDGIPVLEGVSGPLAGLAYAVKDNIDTVLLPTSASTPALVDSRRSQDNPVVRRLDQAGARMVGKTNLH